jgi:hypothetical protein
MIDPTTLFGDCQQFIFNFLVLIAPTLRIMAIGVKVFQFTGRKFNLSQPIRTKPLRDMSGVGVFVFAGDFIQ